MFLSILLSLQIKCAKYWTACFWKPISVEKKINIFQHPDVVGAAIRDYGPVLLTNGTDYQMADFEFNVEGAVFGDSTYLKRAKIGQHPSRLVGICG